MKLRVKVDASGCWLWQGARGTLGYGNLKIGGKAMLIHRVMYTVYRGTIPKGKWLDHLCRVRHCCNPDHLEAVSPQENVLRGEGHAAVNSRKTHCLNGHEFSGTNLIILPNGTRQCRECRNTYSRRYMREQAKKKRGDKK